MSEALRQHISSLKATIQRDQEKLAELEAEQKRLLEMDSISHNDAIDKLREIYHDACRSESARDFISGVIQDKQLREWFGEM